MFIFRRLIGAIEIHLSVGGLSRRQLLQITFISIVNLQKSTHESSAFGIRKIVHNLCITTLFLPKEQNFINKNRNYSFSMKKQFLKNFFKISKKRTWRYRKVKYSLKKINVVFLH